MPAIGPCPTIIQISRTPRHWKFTQDHRTTRPPMKCHTNVEATPTSTSVGRHFVFMCLLASERLLHLTYHKTVSQKVYPPQIPLSWLLNCGCHCSPLKCCSRGPNIASYSTIDKCSGVQINLYLKLTKKNYLKLTKKKNISNLHFPSIHPSDLPQNCISNLHYLSIHLSILPSIHISDLPQELSPFIHLTYHKIFLKLTLIHASNLKLTLIHPSIHPSSISNLHYPFIHPSI